MIHVDRDSQSLQSFQTRLGDFQIAECEGKSGYFFKRKGVFWFIKQINNK